jgi:hypothetical protein
MVLSLTLDYPLDPCDSVVVDGRDFFKDSGISERMSSDELAVNRDISPFRWPNKKKSLGAASGEWAGWTTFVALVWPTSGRERLVL